MHAAGVLHRDVKPSNVLMEGRTPILIDFGLARVADDPKLTHTGWLLGTPGYLPPEILHGDDATAASDVHSWGATVAYAGLGRSPYGSGPSMAIMDRVRRGDHDLTGLPDALARLVESALDPDPARRPTLDRIRHLLDPDRDPRTPLPDGPPDEPEDLFTMPLALAAQAGVLPQVRPDDVTEVRPTLVDPAPPGRWVEDRTPSPPSPPGAPSRRTSGTTTGRTTAGCRPTGGSARRCRHPRPAPSAPAARCCSSRPPWPWRPPSRRSPTWPPAWCWPWCGCCAAAR